MHGEDESNNKHDSKGYVLFVVLAILVLLIIILVAALIIFRVQNSSSVDDSGNSEQGISELSERDKALMEADESYQISLKISDTYNGGEKEKAMAMYDEELRKALEKKDYDLYVELNTAMSTMLALDGTCEESMAQYDRIDFSLLPEEYREIIYNNAIDDSVRCNDVNKEQYWRSLVNEK